MSCAEYPAISHLRIIKMISASNVFLGGGFKKKKYLKKRLPQAHFRKICQTNLITLFKYSQRCNQLTLINLQTNVNIVFMKSVRIILVQIPLREV